MQTINPATEEVIKTWRFLTDTELESVLAKAALAQKHWHQQALTERLGFLPALKKSLEDRFEELAAAIVNEMGKPLAQARAEIQKSLTLCDYYQDVAATALAPKEIAVEGLNKSYLSYQPKGVILGIMPWNFPLWQVMRFAVPAILTGNSVLLKHAPNTFGCGELIGQIFSNKGWKSDVFQNIRVNVDQVKTLLADSRIQGVSFTGSTAGGMQVAELAGRHMKKALFELGGSDAYLVLEDADVELAAKKLVSARMLNAGQSCVAAKRFIAVGSIGAEFTEAVVERMKAYQFSNPMGENCQLGPLARKDLRDGLHRQVERAISQGAQCVLGGKIPGDRGFYYPATVLAGVEPRQTTFSEEFFGPVASIILARDEDHAVELANASPYGLGGGVFSKDIHRAEHIARERMECGMVAVNDSVRSFAALPFGGEKHSGFGRELGEQGLYEFANIKTVMVN